MFRRFVFWAHLVLGLIAGAVIFIMALTGAMMAFEPQILDAAERRVRFVEAPAGARKLPLSAIVVAAAKTKPAAPSGVYLKSDPSASVMVQFGKDGGAVYVNPYSGEALGGDSKAHEFLHFAEDVHRRLAGGDNGRKFTGAANFIFLFLVLGGLYLWWPRNWNWESLKKIVVFNSGLSGKQRDWNWHNVFGVWCLPVLLLTTLTGLTMSYAWAGNLLFTVTGSTPPPAPQKMQKPGGAMSEKKPGAPAVSVDYDAVLAAVDKQAPGWKTLNIRLPKDAAGSVTASVLEAGARHPFTRSQMNLNAQTSEIMKWEPYSGYNAGRKSRIWARYLHTGESFGLSTQIAAFAAAVGALMLVWTGFGMSIFRFKNWRRRTRAPRKEELSMKNFFNPVLVIALCLLFAAPKNISAHTILTEGNAPAFARASGFENLN